MRKGCTEGQAYVSAPLVSGVMELKVAVQLVD